MPAPSAHSLASPAAACFRHSSFYRFTPVADPAALARTLRRLGGFSRSGQPLKPVATRTAESAGRHPGGPPPVPLGGTLIVAPEGISGAIAGPPDALAAFEHALQQPAVLGGALRGMAFKHSPCATAPFGRLKVSVKPEIVALGDLPTHRPSGPAAGEAASATASAAPLPPPDEHDASHLSPAAWRELLARPEVVLLDNRNHFEFRLGRFKGAVDPGVQHFKDFVAYVQAHAPEWRAAGRPVAMYCTGGIRCDKTAPWMRSLGLDVWQLDGGIVSYFQHLMDAGDDAAHPGPGQWEGECFVFDQRLAIDTRLQPTGIPADQVFDPRLPDEAWRLQRARRLNDAAGPSAAPGTRSADGAA